MASQLKTGSFITPRARLQHFAVYLVPDRLARSKKTIPQHVLDRLPLIAGPFPTRYLAVQRLVELTRATVAPPPVKVEVPAEVQAERVEQAPELAFA